MEKEIRELKTEKLFDAVKIEEFEDPDFLQAMDMLKEMEAA